MSQGPDYYFDKRKISIVAVNQVMMATLGSLASLFACMLHAVFLDHWLSFSSFFPLVMALSVLRFTAADCSFGLFKRFIQNQNIFN
jgi:hypothetical protein